MAHPFSKLWFYPLCRLWIRKINGQANIPTKGPFIVISNHEKLIDPLIVSYFVLKKLNKKTHYVSNAAWWFLGDTICRKWAGCIPLFDSRQASEEIKNHLKKGNIVGIFPQGNYKKSTNKEFKTGFIKLSLETDAPILPVGIKSSYVPFISTVNIGKPVYLKKNKEGLEKQAKHLKDYVYGLRNQG
jgi:1-acyl-sn-glycerol-3-phosphate acyltransferase